MGVGIFPLYKQGYPGPGTTSKSVAVESNGSNMLKVMSPAYWTSPSVFQQLAFEMKMNLDLI